MPSGIEDRKGDIVQKVVEKDRKFIGMAFDAVIEYFEDMENSSKKCESEGTACSEMIANECAGMPFVTEPMIRQVLDVMYREGLLDRKIPEGTGTPHYSMK